MKGIVFTEFMDMVETRFGADMVDDLIEATHPESGGSYTSVGTYHHQELVAMVGELSARTGVAASDLVHAFGRHLADVFATKFSGFFEACSDTVSFLKRIDDHIHVEVRKLYPDAELPRFSFDDSRPEEFLLTYESTRNFAALAHGLIEGCAQHYREQFTIRLEDLSDATHTRVRFHLQSA